MFRLFRCASKCSCSHHVQQRRISQKRDSNKNITEFAGVQCVPLIVVVCARMYSHTWRFFMMHFCWLLPMQIMVNAQCIRLNISTTFHLWNALLPQITHYHEAKNQILRNIFTTYEMDAVISGPDHATSSLLSILPIDMIKAQRLGIVWKLFELRLKSN